jgi:hypothetical protein
VVEGWAFVRYESEWVGRETYSASQARPLGSLTCLRVRMFSVGMFLLSLAQFEVEV